MFINPFVFYGRIRRMEYALSMAVFFLALVVIAVEGGDDKHSIYYILFFPLLWFRVAQSAKRCHDLGNSGWFQLIPFYSFWLLFADGEPGRNQYGENPKYDNYLNRYNFQAGEPKSGDAPANPANDSNKNGVEY